MDIQVNINFTFDINGEILDEMKCTDNNHHYSSMITITRIMSYQGLHCCTCSRIYETIKINISSQHYFVALNLRNLARSHVGNCVIICYSCIEYEIKFFDEITSHHRREMKLNRNMDKRYRLLFFFLLFFQFVFFFMQFSLDGHLAGQCEICECTVKRGKNRRNTVILMQFQRTL